MTTFTTSQKLYMSLVKRPIGFLGALVALILLSPIFICTIVFLHFANKGAGVFFTQDRPGKNEKIFKALKFKTMTDERDALKDLSHIMMNDYLKADICIIGSACRKFRRYRLP